MISTAEKSHKGIKLSLMERETRTQAEAFQEEERMTHLMGDLRVSVSRGELKL